MAEKKRNARTITENVADFEELVSVNRSIYPWDSLGNGDGNFFVECDDLDAARASKASIKSSGLNYYLKRQIKLVPVAVVVQMGDKLGVLCTAIAVE